MLHKLETPDFTIESEIDLDHPKTPLIEVRIVSGDDLLVEEFRTDAQNLHRIAKFFEQVAQKAGY